MRFGVTFPQTEFEHSAAAVRDYAQTAEELGYAHILAYDHVLGANPDRPGGWQGVYDHEDPFLEPLVMYSYMAGATKALEFVTGIVILPQRQTALVAKQAATLDLLCEGRLRFGIGIGWNYVEYESLGYDFHVRGRRIEEQIALLRELWTKPLVTFEGEWDRVPDAGLNPLPVQRPIPIWFGAREDVAIRRAARLGDGWMPLSSSSEEAKPKLAVLDEALAEAGRTRDEFGLEPRISFGKGDVDALAREVKAWEALGATHLSLNTMRLGYTSNQQHLDAIETFASVIGLG